MSVSFSYNPTPSTPLGFTAKLTPSWGGQADSGAMSFELGIEGTRRESSRQGGTDHGALARLTARW